jgi:ribosomal protein S12 methylthiotransferase accessory factor
MISRSGRSVPAQWLPFLGPKLGLAKRLYQLATDPDDFDLHQVFPAVTSLGRLLDHPHAFDPRAGGASTELTGAINCAMGELLERYASFACDGTDRIVLSYAELAKSGRRSVPFEELRPFSSAQYRSEGFPYAEFTAQTQVGWLAGTNLLDGLPTYVPGQLVALGYSASSEEIANCFYPTSSGCALATSREEALLKGILETIERDAVMIHWYARIAPPLLDFDPTDLLNKYLGPHKQGLEVKFHDLTLSGDIPVVGVSCVERTGRPCCFILSAACALDVSSAARKALVEAAQGRPFIKSLGGASDAPPAGATFGDFNANLRFHAEPSNLRYVDWFTQNASVSTRKFPNRAVTGAPLGSLQYVLGRCADMAMTPIGFDMTTPELADAGLFVCKVTIPELVPLGVPSAPFLGHPRLAHFIAINKTNGVAAHVPDWIPHPFP